MTKEALLLSRCVIIHASRITLKDHWPQKGAKGKTKFLLFSFFAPFALFCG